MPVFSPYVVKHIHLDQEQDFYVDTTPPEKCYYLFWWKQIPLGHLFAECDDHADRDEFQLKVLRTIQPCVDFYIFKAAVKNKPYKTAFLKYNYEEFSGAMHAIFSSQMVTETPKPLDVSVIVCTRNRSRNLQCCLHSLLNQKFTPREIIVVDNAPTDDSTLQVVQRFPGVIYHNEPRSGLSIARNAGLRRAGAPVVAFTDDDVIAHPLWLYRVWETFLLPEVSAMTGLVVPIALETESQQLFEKYWSFNRGYEDRLFGPEFIDRHLQIGPPVWQIGAGANMAFRKSVFEGIGYFDERLGAGASGCSEDTELWYRILLKGLNVYYNPRAVAYHEHRKEFSAFRRQMYSYVRGHAAAALIQQKLNQKAGYRKRIFMEYPVYYLRRLVKGFPHYRLKDRTLFSEMRGWSSGILFYKKYCSKPPEAGYQ